MNCPQAQAGPRAPHTDMTDVRAALVTSGLTMAQAETISTLIPDWSQFVTKQDLQEMETRLGNKMLKFVLVPIGMVIVLFMITYVLNTFVGPG